MTASNDNTAKVWDALTLQLGTLSGHKGGVISVSHSPDGRRIVTASEDCTAKVWDASRFVCLHTIPNVFGLEVIGVDLRHLYPKSRLSDETRKLLYRYGATLDQHSLQFIL